MQRITSYVTIAITLVTTWLLHKPIHSLPPIARFIDPFQGFWQNAERDSLSFPTQLTLAGLKAPVHVYFDEALIPHIEGQDDLDVYFTQGYITAFHRLWQMEFQTHLAAGRLSEIIGQASINHDRLQRRKGILYATKNAYAIIEQDTLLRDIVQAYTNGVNAYIKSLNYKKLPLEYKLLAYKPEPWTPLKTAIMGIQMADFLTGFERSLEYIQANELLDPAMFSFLFPTTDLVNDPVIPKGTPWSFKPLAAPTAPGSAVTGTKTLTTNRETRPVLKATHRPIDGSNNWAIHGKKTNTGFPYLAADLHLNLRMPSLWYGIHLVSPTLNVAGASLVGTPGILLGFNESVAWGITNAGWCVRDWYTIDFKDSSRSEYYYDSVLLKSQWVIEDIKVRQAETVYDTVIYTHLGPIVYDDTFSNPRYQKNLAMKWTGHHPGNEIFGFYLLNRAKNLTDCERALCYHHIPVQNFVLASKDNEIGLTVSGYLPLRLKGKGRSIMPGNQSIYYNSHCIPMEHHPRIINPSQGYVSSANQRITDASYPYYYAQFYEESYRSRRINQVLSQQQKKIDLKMMMNLQNDNYNLAAQENVSFLLSFIDPTQLDTPTLQAYQLIAAWDFENDPEQLAPSVFKAWQNQLQDTLWHFLEEYTLALPRPDFYHTMHIIKNYPTSPYLKLPDDTSLSTLIQASFKSAVSSLQQWQDKNQQVYKWGDYHSITIPHLAQINSFAANKLRIGGGDGIVNANQGSHGASVRLIVSLEKQVKGWIIYAGGQSGNPGSPHYTKFLDSWCKGKYVPLSLTLPPIDKRPNNRTYTLLPTTM